MLLMSAYFRVYMILFAWHNQAVRNEGKAKIHTSLATPIGHAMQAGFVKMNPVFYACNLGNGTTCSGMVMTTYYMSNILLRILLSTRVDFDVKLRLRKGNNPQVPVA
ncbi:hypothetical protein A7321_09460 [Klebsiella pneumoniae]|nr:hypothetical protein A7321_09460 [Klebsiella pneumoniae]ANN53127.1 hypothetical protein BAU11_16400 [Klebsiella pneumoniae]